MLANLLLGFSATKRDKGAIFASSNFLAKIIMLGKSRLEKNFPNYCLKESAIDYLIFPGQNVFQFALENKFPD